MCGILGGTRFKDFDTFKKGQTTIMHRGYDGNVIFKFKKNKFFICHNRLSIQDLSESANQPLISEDEKFVLAFNGEMWKPFFRKFNAKLRKKYNFKTDRSDSELLLYYLIEHRDNLSNAMNDLDGMFCFAFYDVENNKVTLGRDFIGRLPLYYLAEENTLIFSSEVKAITSSDDNCKFFKSDVKRPTSKKANEFEDNQEIDFRTLIDSSKNKDEEQKIKDVIKVVEPGTLVSVNCDEKSFDININRWFNFKEDFNPIEPNYYPKTNHELELLETSSNKNDKNNIGVDYYAKEFRNRLEKAVDDELISDTPICTILSGGIDSTIITYLLKKKYPNIEAFVVNVDTGRKQTLKDDLYYAKLASEEIGVTLNIVNITKEDIEKNLKQSIYAVETHKWTQVAPAAPQIFLSHEIGRRGFKVVFGGEGADEIFASYGDVKRFCWPNPLHWHQKRVKLINNLHKNNLIRTNKAMMWGGEVELRTPFLNKDLIDFGLRIPTRYRDEADGKGNIMKYVLRKAFEGEISDELLWRPKKTFQQGCHSDYLKKHQGDIDNFFEELFVQNKVPFSFKNRNLGQRSSRIQEIEFA